MNVFLTGGTGFVGEQIVTQLHEAGHSIRMLVRDPNSPRVREIASRYGAEIHRGNVSDTGSLKGALAGVQAVIHLVGIISEAGVSTFDNIHTRGTKHVVAATQQAGVKRFLHMSALGTRPNAVARYHQTKWAAEEIVRQSDVGYSIFRPSLIYGRHDHFVNLFAQVIRRSPVVPVLGRGRTRFQPVAVETVSTAFVKALTESGSVGHTYDLCGPDALTLPEMLDQILQSMGRKRWKLRIPLGLARSQAALLEFVFPRLLRKAPPLNRDQLTMLEEDNLGNGESANRLFGLAPVSFREGIGRYLKR